MSNFDRLHPNLRHAIVHDLGWRALRPVQEQAIAAILDDTNVVMLAPTKQFVQGLPNGKIPDRDDFKIYFQKDRERFAVWDQVVEACRPPTEAFMELVASGRIREKVQPMDL